MADNILRFKERRFLGITERRWQRIGKWALIAAVVLVWALAAYRFDAERSSAALSDAWGLIGSRLTDDGATLRQMPTCLGPIRHNCVVDGDTAWVDGEKIRISGIDAPEIEGKCSYERSLAQRAKHRLSELLSSEPFAVARAGRDRYGRTLATVYLRTRGDVGSALVDEGLARVWMGRRMPWC